MVILKFQNTTNPLYFSLVRIGINGCPYFVIPDGTPQKLLDVSKMKNLGWESKIPPKEDIGKTYERYLKSLKS